MIKGFLKKFWANLTLIAPLSLLVFAVVSIITFIGVMLFKHLHVALALLVFFVIITLIATLVYTLFSYDPSANASTEPKEKKRKNKKGEELADILPFMPRDDD